jgi:surface protein
MKEMFSTYGEGAFNQPIGRWNTSQVTDMSDMFRQAKSINQDLRGWVVNPNVILCEAFSLDATSWKLPKPSFDSCNP